MVQSMGLLPRIAFFATASSRACPGGTAAGSSCRWHFQRCRGRNPSECCSGFRPRGCAPATGERKQGGQVGQGGSDRPSLYTGNGDSSVAPTKLWVGPIDQGMEIGLFGDFEIHAKLPLSQRVVGGRDHPLLQSCLLHTPAGRWRAGLRGRRPWRSP